MRLRLRLRLLPPRRRGRCRKQRASLEKNHDFTVIAPNIIGLKLVNRKQARQTLLRHRERPLQSGVLLT